MFSLRGFARRHSRFTVALRTTCSDWPRRAVLVWQEAQRIPVVSTNRGVTTTSYKPAEDSLALARADDAVARAFGSQPSSSGSRAMMRVAFESRDGMSDMTGPDSEHKEASRLTKEEWREYTKTVWSIANLR